MKFSPKQLLVKKHVRAKMVWFGQLCYACNHKIMFETMFLVGDPYTAYCMDCCPTKDSAFDASFPTPVTPNDIILFQEKEKVRQILYNLLNDIDDLPDGEVSPSVYNILLQYSPDTM